MHHVENAIQSRSTDATRETQTLMDAWKRLIRSHEDLEIVRLEIRIINRPHIEKTQFVRDSHTQRELVAIYRAIAASQKPFLENQNK